MDLFRKCMEPVERVLKVGQWIKLVVLSCSASLLGTAARGGPSLPSPSVGAVPNSSDRYTSFQPCTALAPCICNLCIKVLQQTGLLPFVPGLALGHELSAEMVLSG